MARNFGGGDDRIVLDIGSVSSTGAFSVAVMARSAADATTKVYFQSGISTAGSDRILMFLDTSNNCTFTLNNTSRTGDNQTAANGWCMMGCSHSAGTTTPRDHKYVYSTNAWAHSNMSGTTGNSTAQATNCYIGGFQAAISSWNGDIAWAATWSSSFTDAQWESMAFNLTGLFQVQPSGLWILDQSATTMKVNDHTGGGAQENALVDTTVSTGSSPIWAPGQAVMAA